MPPPRKRLRRLANIESVAEKEEEDEKEERELEVEVVEESDLDEIADGEGDEEEEVVMVTRRTTRGLRGRGAALKGRSTNGDVVAVRRRRSTRVKEEGPGVKGRGKRAGTVEDEDEDGFEYAGPKRRKNNTDNSAGKEMPMLMLTLKADRSRREGSSTLTSQPMRNHNPITSLFGGRGTTASAVAFSGSSQRIRQLSQPPSTAATAKLTVPKQTTITSKPIISSQSVVLEDLDDLIQDWNSDGISDDEAEILASVGSQLQVSNSKGRGVRVGGVIVKREMVVGASGWSSQSTQSQPALKKLLPIFRTPQIPSSTLSSLSLSQTIECRDLNLPWPQKHFPTASAELAIHKKKVEAVSDWLSRVREGRLRKRVLILRGPTGCGKTATLDVLAKEGGWDVVEWGNPTGGVSSGGMIGDDDRWKPGGEGFASAFEDWLFRGGAWGCLDLVSSSGVSTNQPSSSSSQNSYPTRRKLLLLEDLPNLSHPGTLLSFRTAIRLYLSLPSPQLNFNLPPIPPLILIVSEVCEGTGSSTNMGMSVYRMLGPQILSHSLLSEIQFRKVARTLLVKCLEDVIRKEGYGGIFEKEVLEALAEQGDLRGAIGGLEMLALGREKQTILGKAGGIAKGVKRKKTATSATQKAGKEILTLLHPRLSTLGIFHSIGKVVYNKRYGDDPSDPYFPPPPTPPPELRSTHRYHSRAMKLDPNTILDESGVEAEMFVYGVQENYLGSFSNGGKKTLEEVLEDVCFCAEALSEADLLLGGGSVGSRISGDLGSGIARVNITWGGGSWGSNGGGEGVLRQEDIATQVMVRSMALGLPSPVKRDTSVGNGYSRGGKLGQNGDGSGAGRGAAQMYYPMGLRLWRVKEEIETVVELWEGRLRSGKGLGGVSGATAGDGEMMPVVGLTRRELVLERLPFMTKIARGKSTATAGGAVKWGSNTGNGTQQRTTKAHSTPKASQGIIRSLEQITTFRGISVLPTTAEPEPELESEEEGGGIAGPLFGLDEDEDGCDWVLMPPPPVLPKGTGGGNRGSDKEDSIGLGEGMDGLVLVEDDIIDDW
ncbi:Rad17 cell cycle checkpoint protein-domain-containing protein [Tirmania nivea]|nr:Rad17 cell cycle checkpoint protein-domain-containing protein [Tirmania nivea]